MKKSKYNSFDELPLMMSVPDVSNVLGIGLANAYGIARRPDFPSIKFGTRIVIPRNLFLDWLNKLASEKGEIN